MINFYDIIHWGLGATFFVVSILLFGCAKPSPLAVIYKPVPCEIVLPLRPTDASDAYLNTLNILRYSEALELTVKACKGE